MNKQRVPTDANDAVASTSVPADHALDALVTGRRTFSRVKLIWRDALIDVDSFDLPETAQLRADSVAQAFAYGLESYLYSCPPSQSIQLAGELIRGLLYEWMIREIPYEESMIREIPDGEPMILEIPYEPEPLLPMTQHATRSRVLHTADRARKTRAVGRPRPPAQKGAFKPKKRGKTSQQ